MTSSPSPIREEIRRLERLREESPGSLAFVRLAEAYRAAGEHDLALTVLEEGRARAPDHPAIHLVAARVHHDRGRREEERAALERALAADPESEVARTALERLEGAGEDASEGGGSGREDADADSDGRRASHSPEERAQLLEQLGGMSREEWLEGESSGDGGSDEGDGPVTETMARLYARQGLWEEAESVYRRLRRERPDDDEELSRALEAVRNREMPPEPDGRGSRPARRRRTAGAGRAAGQDEDPGEEEGEEAAEPATRSEDGAPPTMRGHLRALLRGGGARPVRRSERSEPARPVADRVAPGPGREGPGREGPAREEEREAGADGSDEEMEELLRRWQRAARGGTEE